MNTWVLSSLYWIHILATVAWLGGQAALLLWVLPLAGRYLAEEMRLPLLAQALRRAMPAQWFSAMLLLATGMFQMSANANYEGFLAISNRWAVAILFKHLAYAAMLGVTAVLGGVYLPQLERAALLAQHNRPAPQGQSAYRRSIQILWVNLGLGVIVLALTALARASS
ncbi:MAG: hypothetical protein Fur0018_02820 [Anaerolineales bacterium]